MANLLALRARTRFQTGITNTTTLSNADILTLLNIGYHLVEQELYKLNQDFFEEQKTKFNLVADQDLYSNPTDFLGMKQLRLAYSTPTNEEDYRVAKEHDAASTIDVEIQEESIPSSSPTYDMLGNYYRIKPTPESNITNGGELYYFARNSDMTATGDIPNIPADYHDLISNYASKEITLKYEDWNKYKAVKNEWEEGINKMKIALGVRETNKQSRMRNVSEDGSTKRVTELWN